MHGRNWRGVRLALICACNRIARMGARRAWRRCLLWHLHQRTRNLRTGTQRRNAGGWSVSFFARLRIRGRCWPFNYRRITRSRSWNHICACRTPRVLRSTAVDLATIDELRHKIPTQAACLPEGGPSSPFNKPSFLAHAQNTPIDAATNSVQNPRGC